VLPFLTIAIPTFNGGARICSTLDTLLNEIAGNGIENIEILVSDNASTDIGPAYLSVYQSRFPGLIKCIKNQTNIGYDRNIVALLNNASGDYVWFIGDDDKCTPGAIKELYEAIHVYDHPAIILCSIGYEDLQSGNHTFHQKFKDNQFFESGDEFFQETLWMSSALSSICIKRRFWQPNFAIKYLDTNWMHLGVIMEILALQPNSVVISKEMAVIGMNNPRWSTNFGNQFRVGLEHLKVLSGLNTLGYQSASYECFKKSRIRNLVVDAAQMNPRGFHEKIKSVALLVTLFRFSPLVWFVVLPIILVPETLTKFLLSKEFVISVLDWLRIFKRSFTSAEGETDS
jgi:glycosyltransferase involved in cell wall biosynthesis